VPRAEGTGAQGAHEGPRSRAVAEGDDDDAARGGRPGDVVLVGDGGPTRNGDDRADLGDGDTGEVRPARREARPRDPAGIAPSLAAALGVGERPALATLQLKADGVFVSVRGRDLFDITQALNALPAQLARLDTRREERRLVYSERAWRIDP